MLQWQVRETWSECLGVNDWCMFKGAAGDRRLKRFNRVEK